MFCEARLMRLARPIPPTPTLAMLSVSLGGTKPRPRTWRGTMVNAAAVAAACEINFRRGIAFSVMGNSLAAERVTRGHGKAADAGAQPMERATTVERYFVLRKSFGVTSQMSWPLGGETRFSSTKATPAFFSEVMWRCAP